MAAARLRVAQHDLEVARRVGEDERDLVRVRVRVRLRVRVRVRVRVRPVADAEVASCDTARCKESAAEATW